MSKKEELQNIIDSTKDFFDKHIVSTNLSVDTKEHYESNYNDSRFLNALCRIINIDKGFICVSSGVKITEKECEFLIATNINPNSISEKNVRTVFQKLYDETLSYKEALSDSVDYQNFRNKVDTTIKTNEKCIKYKNNDIIESIKTFISSEKAKTKLQVAKKKFTDTQKKFAQIDVNKIEEKDILFINEFLELIKNTKETPEQALLESQYELFSVLFNNKDKIKDIGIDEELLIFLIRPYQDFMKVKTVFKQFKNDTIQIKLKFLPNPEGIHAELVIINEKGLNGYIGVSKLSCPLCHNFLEQTKENHLGGHQKYCSSYKVPSLDRLDQNNKDIVYAKIADILLSYIQGALHLTKESFNEAICSTAKKGKGELDKVLRNKMDSDFNEYPRKLSIDEGIEKAITITLKNKVKNDQKIKQVDETIENILDENSTYSTISLLEFKTALGLTCDDEIAEF